LDAYCPWEHTLGSLKEKQEQDNPKNSRQKEVTKNRAEINEM
jgi:hypothetical protein